MCLCVRLKQPPPRTQRTTAAITDSSLCIYTNIYTSTLSWGAAESAGRERNESIHTTARHTHRQPYRHIRRDSDARSYFLASVSWAGPRCILCRRKFHLPKCAVGICQIFKRVIGRSTKYRAQRQGHAQRRTGTIPQCISGKCISRKMILRPTRTRGMTLEKKKSSN